MPALPEYDEYLRMHQEYRQTGQQAQLSAGAKTTGKATGGRKKSGGSSVPPVTDDAFDEGINVWAESLISGEATIGNVPSKERSKVLARANQLKSDENFIRSQIEDDLNGGLDINEIRDGYLELGFNANVVDKIVSEKTPPAPVEQAPAPGTGSGVMNLIRGVNKVETPILQKVFGKNLFGRG